MVFASRFLGNVPHVLVQSFGEGIKDADDIISAAKDVPHVVSVAPFVSKEAMLLSNGNVAAVSVKRCRCRS